jgi:hypothetical protein
MDLGDKQILIALLGKEKYYRNLSFYIIVHDFGDGWEEFKEIEDRFVSCAIDTIKEFLDGCGFGDEVMTRYEERLEEEGVPPARTMPEALQMMLGGETK